MKIVNRSGCFETNSSSMHSIVVTKEKGNSTFLEYNTGYHWEDYRLRQDDIEFGRYPLQLLGSIKDKARYAIASAYNDQEKIQKIIDTVKDITGGTELIVEKYHTEEYRNAETKEEIPWFNVEWVEDTEDEGYEIAILKSEKNLPPDQRTEIEFNEVYEWQGYVDHQSEGLLDRFLAEEKITLREFLEKKKYAVIIDGDECCEFGKFIRAGLINLDNIEKRYD